MPEVNNPWFQWEEAPVLEQDMAGLEAYYQQVRELHEVRTEGLVPFPFFGDPDKAKVWLLLANPGFREQNMAEHKNDEFRAKAKLSLQHKGLHPYLDETFQKYKGNKWWESILQDVLEEFPNRRQQVLSALMCVQLFPYHSKTFSADALQKSARELYSWDYSYHLVLNAIEQPEEQKILIIIMRAPWRNLLQKALPNLLDSYSNIVTLNFREVKQGPPYLNRRCLGNENFERLITTLRETIEALEKNG